MNDEPKKPQRGTTNVFRMLAGGYLLYTAYQMFRLLWTGESDSTALCVIGGVVFAAFGSFILYLEWKAYKYGRDHKDDPSSWTMEPQELEEETTPESDDQRAVDEDDGEEER